MDNAMDYGIENNITFDIYVQKCAFNFSSVGL